MTNLRSFVDRRLPWLARTYRKLRDRWIASRLRFIRTAHGFEFIGDAGMEDSRADEGETALVRESLLTAEVFIDGGANTGFFSMLAGKVGVRTFAFEPNTLNFDLLRRNIARNGFEKIEARQMALGRGPARLQLYGGGQGSSLEPNWGGISSTYSTEVEVESLDNLLADRFSTAPSTRTSWISLNFSGRMATWPGRPTWNVA